MASSLKPTLNVSQHHHRPQLNAGTTTNAKDEENKDDENTDKTITPHDSYDNLQRQNNDENNGNGDLLPREQILKTFEPPTKAMTLSQFKNCLMKKRVGELNETLEEEGEEGERKSDNKRKKTDKKEHEDGEETAGGGGGGTGAQKYTERKKLEIERYALTQTLAGAKSRFEAERIATKHTEAMQRVRAAKQEANAAIEKVNRLADELKEKEEEARKSHKEEREKRAQSRKMDASKREERKIVVEAELSRREKERHRLVTNLKQTIAEEAEVRKKMSGKAS
jgi:hypothetical protein